MLFRSDFSEKLPIDVVTLDTGRLFPETRDVWAETERRYGIRVAAFTPETRDFYRIDHLATAMGVLLIPAFENERANGVAVSADPVYDTPGAFYVNAQVGEDLVTNPDVRSTPEELLVGADGSVAVAAHSSLVEPGGRVLDDRQAAGSEIVADDADTKPCQRLAWRGAALARSGQHAEQQRDVGDRAPEWTRGVLAARDGDDASLADSSERRFDGHDAVRRGRAHDRAVRLRADGERRESRRDRDR